MKPSTKAPPRSDVQITLGDGWQRFAFRTPGLAFLGTIRRGMEIGALARDEAGGYLQVNGDVQQVLNKSRVAAHLRKAGVRTDPIAATFQPTQTPRPPIPVVFKRRRRMLVPQV
ncbi:hypothetical protein FN976_23880 [Caenimonas sedimenti]|uniref:Uncharacterized protein n=1 Tax=Caenimonas sedimenti TaxID=2596921 RepID=A0A562ZHD6_9BURK|nr:hypothetical protein [Caenimonas sedimenti]TWO67992.1 hypothetical protein FN976_23880 [Caenimonas sedimenti]